MPDRPSIAAYFEQPQRAYVTTGVLLVLVAAAYICVHAFRTLPAPPWREAIQFAEDGTFKPLLSTEKLDRFFSADKIAELRRVVEERADVARAEALQQRRSLLLRAGELLDRIFRADSGRDSVTPPVRAAGLAKATDKEILQYVLPDLSQWIKAQRVRVGDSQRGELDQFDVDLAAQNAREVDDRKRLQDSVQGLEPQLPFLWLYHQDHGWVFEITMWAWFGVLANTMVGLIASSRKGDYDGGQFILVFPKFLLAPVISVVATALVSAGITESQINLGNLPLFLAFAFFLGFLTESVYMMLRDAGAVILRNPLKVDAAKLAREVRAGLYAWQFQRATTADFKPRTLDEVRSQAKGAAKAVAERHVVTELAKEAS
jgi:hypothetical protein